MKEWWSTPFLVGEGNGNPLRILFFFFSFPFIFISWRLITLPPTQDSCLENSMHREAWRATVHGVTKSRTQLGDYKQQPLLLWKHLWFVMLYVLAHTNYASRSWRELNLTEGSDKAVWEQRSPATLSVYSNMTVLQNRSSSRNSNT